MHTYLLPRSRWVMLSFVCCVSGTITPFPPKHWCCYCVCFCAACIVINQQPRTVDMRVCACSQVPNLAGFARTCEIFAATELVIPDKVRTCAPQIHTHVVWFSFVVL